jgi:hypothetical protein
MFRNPTQVALANSLAECDGAAVGCKIGPETVRLRGLVGIERAPIILRFGRYSPLAENYAYGCLVEHGELKCAPRLLLDGVAVGVEHAGAFSLDLVVEGLDIIGFNGDLGPVFGGVFGTGDDVGLGAIALDDSEVLVMIPNLEAETVDEEVEAFFECVVEDFGDEAEHHLHIGSRPREWTNWKVTVLRVYFARL